MMLVCHQGRFFFLLMLHLNFLKHYRLQNKVLPQLLVNGGVAVDLMHLGMQFMHVNAWRWAVGTEASAWLCLLLGHQELLFNCQ